jgi:hypothetical protein
MRWLLIVVIAAAVLMIGFFLYRYHYSEDRLQVLPQARDEIERRSGGDLVSVRRGVLR